MTIGESADVSATVNGGAADIVYLINGVEGSKIDNVEAVSYVVTAVFAGNATHKANSTSRTFTASKMVPDIKVIANPVIVGEDVVFNVDAGDATGIVLVDICGNKYYSELEGGKAVISIAGIDVGDHGANVTYNGDGKYVNSSTSLTVKVNDKADSVIVIDEPELTIGESSTVSATVNGGVADVVYLINGVEGSKIDNVEAVSYTVTAIFAGNATHKTNSTSRTFTASKIVPDIKIAADPVIVGEDVTLNINVENATGFVLAEVDGNKYYAGLEDGKAAFVLAGIIKNTTAKVTYFGDDKCASNTNSFDIEVSKVSDVEMNVDVESEPGVGDVSIYVNLPEDAAGEVVAYINGRVVANGSVDYGYANLNIPELKEGLYNVTVVYSGDEKYEAASQNVSFNVVKSSPYIYVDAEDVALGENTTIFIDLSYGIDNITVILDGTPLDNVSIDEYAQVYITREMLVAGNHSVVVIFNGNDKYTNGSNNATFHVAKADASLKVALPENVTAGESSTVKVEVPNASGKVVVSVSDRNFTGTINNGVCDVKVDGLASGVHDVAVSYLGDDNYNAASESAQLTVSQKDAKININVAEDIVKVDIPGASDNVSVIVDGIESNIALDENGSASIALANLTSGNHGVVVIYPGDDTYAPAYASVSFNVPEEVVPPKEESNATVSIPENIRPGEDASVDVVIPDATGNVSVIVDGRETVVALVNGSASVPIEDLASGNHSVVVIYSGDETHAPTYSASAFNVPSEIIPPKHVSEFSDITVSGDHVIAFTLMDDTGSAIANAKVTCAVNGKTFDATTDAKGAVVINASAGSVIELKYAGNDAVLPTNTTITIKDLAPARMATSIVGDNYTQYAVEYYAGERGQNFTVKLVDERGNPIANRTVYIGYNGKTLVRTTDATGHASLQINLKDANRLTFAVAYLGDEDYNATMSVYLITIIKKPVTITVPSQKTYKKSAKTKKYAVTLSTIKGASADGKTYFGKGKQVSMKVNGKTYTAKTNDNGQVTFNLKINKKGRFTAVISYAGDNTYEKASRKATITIK